MCVKCVCESVCECPLIRVSPLFLAAASLQLLITALGSVPGAS